MENGMNSNVHQDEEAATHDTLHQEPDTPQQHQGTGRQKIEINRLRTPIPAPVWLAALTLALIADIIPSLAEAAVAGGSYAPFAFLQPLRAVPEWLTTVIWYAVYIAIIITFYRNLRHVKAMARPLLIAAVCMTVLCLCLIPAFDKPLPEEDMSTPMILMLISISLVVAIVLLTLLVVLIILPIRMLTRFTGRIRNVGKWGLVSICADIVVMTMSAVFVEYCAPTYGIVIYTAAMLCSLVVEFFLLKSIYTLLVSND